MGFISVTRLRIRRIGFLPGFAMHTMRALKQARAAPGFQDGSVLADRKWTFWTLTAWDSQDRMRDYMTAGDHRTAMPHLLDWCDEASVVHWDHPESALPSWSQAVLRMRHDGRPSKVRFPSPDHDGLTFPEPRTATAAPIRPAKSHQS